MVPRDELDDIHEHTRSRRFVLVAVGAVIAISLGIVVLRPAEEKRGAEGKAPAMSLAILGGERRLTDADLRGTPVVLNLWASWCDPCRREAKVFEAAHQKYGDRIRFIGVDVKDTVEAAQAFIEEFGVTYTNVFDEGHRFADALGYAGLPQTYFIDAEWNYVTVDIDRLGELNKEELEAGIEALLDGS